MGAGGNPCPDDRERDPEGKVEYPRDSEVLGREASGVAGRGA